MSMKFEGAEPVLEGDLDDIQSFFRGEYVTKINGTPIKDIDPAKVALQFLYFEGEKNLYGDDEPYYYLFPIKNAPSSWSGG